MRTLQRPPHASRIGFTHLPSAGAAHARVLVVGALFLLVTAGGLGLRAWRLGGECAHWDEVASLRHLEAPALPAFLREVRHSDPPMTPVYFTLEYFWARMTGGSVPAMRGLSLCLAAVCFPLFFLVANRLCGTAGALAGLAAFALSAGQIYYAQEIRPYALILVLTLVSGLGLWRAQETSEKRWWAVNIGANVLLMWTHLFTIFFLASQGLFLATRCVQGHTRPRVCVLWMTAHLPSAALLLFWVGSIDTASLAEAASWREQIHHSYLQLLGDFLLFCGAGVPMFRDLPAWRGGPNMGGIMWRFFAIVVGLYLALAWRRTQDDPNMKTKLLFLVCWVVAPSVLQFLVSALVYSCHGSRYVLSGSLPWLMMIGGSVSLMPGRLAKAALAAVVMGVYLLNLAAHPRPWRPDAAEVLAHEALQEPGGTPIVVYRAADVPVLEYMNGNRRVLPPFLCAPQADDIVRLIGPAETGGGVRRLVLFQHEHPDTLVDQVQDRLSAAGWDIERTAFGYTNPAFVYALRPAPG